jgi:hypothetical protein
MVVAAAAAAHAGLDRRRQTDSVALLGCGFLVGATGSVLTRGSGVRVVAHFG